MGSGGILPTGPIPRQTRPSTQRFRRRLVWGLAAQPLGEKQVEPAGDPAAVPASGPPHPRRSLERLQHPSAWRSRAAATPEPGSTVVPRPRSAGLGGRAAPPDVRTAAAKRLPPGSERPAAPREPSPARVGTRGRGWPSGSEATSARLQPHSPSGSPQEKAGAGRKGGGRAARPPPSAARGLSQRAGVALRPGGLSPEPSAAPAAARARPSGSVSRHSPAPFRLPGSAISRILGGKRALARRGLDAGTSVP